MLVLFCNHVSMCTFACVHTYVFVHSLQIFESRIWGINFSAGTKKITSSRSVYTALDLLGDVGGLYGMLSLIAGSIVSAFNDNYLFNNLVSLVFYE